jgi:hypothetical protein
MSLMLRKGNLRQPREPLGIFVLDPWRCVNPKADPIAAGTLQSFAAPTGETRAIAIGFNRSVATHPQQGAGRVQAGQPRHRPGPVQPHRVAHPVQRHPAADRHPLDPQPRHRRHRHVQLRPWPRDDARPRVAAAEAHRRHGLLSAPAPPISTACVMPRPPARRIADRAAPFGILAVVDPIRSPEAAQQVGLLARRGGGIGLGPRHPRELEREKRQAPRALDPPGPGSGAGSSTIFGVSRPIGPDDGLTRHILVGGAGPTGDPSILHGPLAT